MLYAIVVDFVLLLYVVRVLSYVGYVGYTVVDFVLLLHVVLALSYVGYVGYNGYKLCASIRDQRRRDRETIAPTAVAQSLPARGKLRSRAVLLSLTNHVPMDVVELVCREMWENPMNDFIAGQGWLRQRWTWTRAALILDLPPFRLPDVLRHINLPRMWEHGNEHTWQRTIRECSVEFCEALLALSRHPEWTMPLPEICLDGEIHLSFNSNTMMRRKIQRYGDPVLYECTRRYIELGL